MKQLIKKSEIVLFCIFFIGLSQFAFAQEIVPHSSQSSGDVNKGQENSAGNISSGIPSEEKDKPISREAAPPVNQIMEVRRLDTIEPLYSFELRDADIVDLFRLLAHQFNLNLLIDNTVQGKITASLNKVTLEEGIDNIAKICNLELKKAGNFVKLKPHLITKTITLKYLEAKTLLEKGSGSSANSSATAQSAAVSTSASNGETAKNQNTIFDLLSQAGKILLGNQPNTLMIIDYTENVEKIENYIQMVDQRMLSKVFQLKYLNVQDILGKAQTGTSNNAGQ